MAEIKSTLELVMERTRRLTMSEADRREQAAAEYRSALNRIIQQYLDGDYDPRRFREQLAKLEQSGHFSDRGIAIGEIAGRIDPDGDNRLLLDLLESVCGVDVSGIRVLLVACSQSIDKEVETVRRRITEDLKEEGISGNAVVPNLDLDEDLVRERKKIVERCRESLKAELSRVTEA